MRECIWTRLAPRMALVALLGLLGACGDAPVVPEPPDDSDGASDVGVDRADADDLGGADAADAGRDGMDDPDYCPLFDLDEPDADDAGDGGGDGSLGDTALGDASGPDLARDAGPDAVDCPDDVDGDGSRDIAASGIFAIENTANVLSYYVEWSTPEPTTTRLEVDCGDYAPTIVGCDLSTSHSVFLMGLYPGAECTLTTTGRARDGARVMGSTEIEVSDVPEHFPELALEVADGARLAPGWTLLNLNNEFDRIPFIGVLVDEQGRYRWYHQRAGSAWGSDTEVQTVPEGLLFGGREPMFDAAIVDWEGTVVWSPRFNMHHDIQPLSETRYAFLGFEGNCPEQFAGIPSDTVNIWDRAEGRVVWSWRICEHVTPDPIVPDWSHLNTVQPFPDEPTALLLSSRNQHTIYRLDTNTGNVDWSIGQNGTFTLTQPEGAPAPDFYRQHAPEFVDDEHILLFDNGRRGTREFSRAVELAIDVDAETAEAVWEYVPEPQIFAPIWGDADRLNNGNTLVTFGLRDENPDFISHVIEVSPESAELWDLTFPVKWGVYRSERVPDVPAGFVL